MRRDGGSAAILVIVLLPLLLATVTGVVQLGAARVIAGRIASAADLATLAARLQGESAGGFAVAAVAASEREPVPA